MQGFHRCAPGGRGPTFAGSTGVQEEEEMKHTIAITAAAVAIIVAVAFSTLAVFSARAGQQHGLDCAKVSNPCAK
jgi:hypothetical protein